MMPSSSPGDANFDAPYERVLLVPAKPLLRVPAKVQEVTVDVRARIESMVRTMRAYEGIGLAANQIGWDAQVFVMVDPDQRERSVAFINPEIEFLGPAEPGIEGCLSLPGVMATIARPTKLEITYLDIEGHYHKGVLEGLAARICCHEIDHLRAVTLFTRMHMVDLLANRPALRKLGLK